MIKQKKIIKKPIIKTVLETQATVYVIECHMVSFGVMRNGHFL